MLLSSAAKQDGGERGGSGERDKSGERDGFAMRHAATSRRSAGTGARSSFAVWRRQRPFVGGLLTILGGVELFFSGQLDVGKIHVQLGIEGLQATIIPVLLILLGVLAIAMPVHRIFYGVIALAVAVYSLIGVNLGGFFIGMLLATVGGVLIVAWMPKTADGAVAADALHADGGPSADATGSTTEGRRS